MLKCRRLPDRTRLSAPLACILNPADDEDVMTTVERVLGK